MAGFDSGGAGAWHTRDEFIGWCLRFAEMRQLGKNK